MKDTDKLRVILELSALNHYIVCPHFKMLTLQDVKLLLPEGFYTISLDLTDGYWHFPIAPAKRRCLGFSYLGPDYWFRALPFGLNVAPRIFTKLVTCVESRHFYARLSRRIAYRRSFRFALRYVSPDCPPGAFRPLVDR